MLFPNPFSGKPAPLETSGLVLIDPSAQVKLDDMPMRSLLESELGTALYKRMARANKKQAATPEPIKMMLNELQDSRTDRKEASLKKFGMPPTTPVSSNFVKLKLDSQLALQKCGPG